MWRDAVVVVSRIATLAVSIGGIGCGGGGGDAANVSGQAVVAPSDRPNPFVESPVAPALAAPVPNDPSADPITDRAPDASADDTLATAPAATSGTGADAADDDATARRFEARVANGFVDARNHDSWICTGEVRSGEYRLNLDADGSRHGVELDGRGGDTDRTFGWAAIGEDTLLFDYRETGRQVELSSVLFDGQSAFRANDAASGPLECRRQRYVDGRPTRDVSNSGSGDIDPDVVAATALAERIETPRAGDGSFDPWRCEVADGLVGYVFAGEGLLGPERFALAFDIPPDGPPGPVRELPGEGGERLRWLATDGTTLLLVSFEDDVMAGGTLDTTILDGIVFLVDDAFTARRADGASLQCLRNGPG